MTLPESRIPSLDPVVAAFDSFVAADPTYSAQLAVHVGAERVLDLTAGVLQADSLLPVYSSSKGATATVVALLVDRGLLDLDAPVASYWPEFAAGDKAGIPVRQLLSHQAGLPGVDGGFTWDELLDHDALAARLAAQRPFWRPGAGFMYHALTIGTLADELVRRIDGRPVAEVLHADVTGPRAIDVWMGLPESEDARVVDALPPTAEELTAGPLPPLGADPLATLPLPRGDLLGLFSRVNDASFRRAAPPAAGVVASARGLGALYACLRHEINGVPRLVGDDTLARMAQVQVAGTELGTGLDARFGVLFQVPDPPRWDFGGVGAFGHDGAGGSLAFYDPSVDVAFGYTVQRLPLPGGMDPRAMELTRLIRRARRES